MIIIETLLEYQRNPNSPNLGYLRARVPLWQDVFSIKKFADDGFQRVCTVHPQCNLSKWYYENIDRDLMFSEHNSWVYFIVLDDWIVKVGETGSPLGIAEMVSYHYYAMQPIHSSKCRLGRLRGGDNTDANIRRALDPYIKAGHTVSIWAKKCQHTFVSETVRGRGKSFASSVHKELELAYLDYFIENTQLVPDCNKVRK